jgi:hypothetical protein
MTSPYADKIPQMYNSEVVALAKNRFTDAETQLAIAKWGYKLGQSYLAANENITDEAAKVLWGHRGYVLKSELLRRGRIKLKKHEYTEVYRKYFKNNTRSQWRMLEAFLGGYVSYWNTAENTNNTPSDLLDEIYNDLPENDKRRWILERFISHQNCSLELAIRLSVIETPDMPNNFYRDDFEKVRQAALLKVAEITKQQLEAR